MKRTFIVAALALVGLAVPCLTKADDPPAPVEVYDLADPLVICRWRVDAEYIAEARWQFVPGAGWAPVIVYRFEIVTASWG